MDAGRKCSKQVCGKLSRGNFESSFFGLGVTSFRGVRVR